MLTFTEIKTTTYWVQFIWMENEGHPDYLMYTECSIIRRAIIDYGDTANDAIVKEIDQMVKKGEFEYITDIPPVVDVLHGHMF